MTNPLLGKRYSLKFLAAALIVGLAKTKFTSLIQKNWPPWPPWDCFAKEEIACELPVCVDSCTKSLPQRPFVHFYTHYMRIMGT